MDVRFGKVKASGETYSNPQRKHFETSEENFFNAFQRQQNQNEQQKEERDNVIPLRLNDFDSNILENKAYNGLPDEILKLEHKITTLEDSITKITKDIQVLEGIGYDIQLYSLKEKREKLIEELQKLKQEYANQDLSTNLSNRIASVVNIAKKNKSVIEKIKQIFTKDILAKVSHKFSYAIAIKEALDNLSNINASVDELIKLQVPHGESIERYQKLTAYLNQANLIHSKISSDMNSITKLK